MAIGVSGRSMSFQDSFLEYRDDDHDDWEGGGDDKGESPIHGKHGD